MKKGGKWRRVLSVVLSLAVVLYLGYQIYSVGHDVLKTEYALDYTYYHTISMDGFILRDELVLPDNHSGVVVYNQSSGSKVSAGHVIAKVFDSEDKASIQLEIDSLTETIDSLQGLQTEGVQLSVNAQALDSRINQTINRMLAVTDSGTTTGYSAVVNDLVQLLNKKQITLGSNVDFSTYLASLQSQKTALEASVGTYSSVSTDTSGYFINGTDGCETLLDYREAANVTYSQLQNALQAETNPTGAIGKVVVSNEWYLIVAADQTLVQELQLGDSVDITIPLLSSEVYHCEVAAFNVDYATQNAVLVLSCGQMNEKIAQARNESIQLRMKTYRGLRINQSALRVVDGITGVYVVDGICAAFRPVEILYSDHGMAICSYDSTKPNSLKQYDEVIVGGGDLYDGKIIR